jgi:hypothetical protein
MKRILLIPHDDRPPNLQFPKLLGRIAGISVVAPPRRLLGSCGTAGDVEGLAVWAESRAPGCDAAIVSLNFVTCGGLVASRGASVPAETAISRIDLLRRLREASPDCKLFAFGSITRSRGVLETPEEHRRARQRNMECLERALALTSEAGIDYLALGQDDARPGGDYVQDRTKLRAMADRLGLSGKVAVMSGTDETAMLLLARATNQMAGEEPKIKVDWKPAETMALVPLFEDEPVSETLSRQAACAGARLVAGPGEADCVLIVLGPTGQQQDAFERSPTETPSHVRGLAGTLEATPGLQGRPLGLCDIVAANGGTPALLDPLGRLAAEGRLHAYAGWNTSANTIGTAIAHLCVLLTWKHREPARGQREAQAEFLNARLIDDILYQGVLRSELTRGRPGRLDKRLPEARLVASRLEDEALSGHAVHRTPGTADVHLEGFKIAWPWRRPFEIELSMRYRRRRPA